MRTEIERLADLGRLPGSDSDISTIETWQERLQAIAPPVSDEEAGVLIGLLPIEDDDSFGLAWTLLHLIESAPSPVLPEPNAGSANPWLSRLRDRQAEHR